MNLFIIGDDIHEIVMDIWRKNTNFTVIGCTDISNKQFLTYIKDRHFILEGSVDQFKNKITEVDAFLDFCDKYTCIPIFVKSTKNEDSFEELMFTNVKNFIKSSALYYRGDDVDGKGLKALKDMCFNYTINKGLYDDTVVRTPKTRKGRPSKK